MYEEEFLSVPNALNRDLQARISVKKTEERYRLSVISKEDQAECLLGHQRVVNFFFISFK